MSVAHDVLEQEFNTPSAALNFWWRQKMMGVHTAMPGIVEEFDPATRRARIRPTPMAVTSSDEVVPRQPLVNVPVMSLSNPRFGMTLDLEPGDAVLLIFCQRGIGEFKKTFEDSEPVRAGFFSASDAVAFPGFGPPLEDAEFSPAAEHDHGLAAGISIQSRDGATHVSVDEEAVRLRTVGDTQVDLSEDRICLSVGDDVQVDVEAGEVKLKGPAIRIEAGGQTKTYQEITVEGRTFWAFD